VTYGGNRVVFPSPGDACSGDPAIGTQIAGYRLEEQIGRGGMAVVYQARDVRLDRWVALKIMAPEAASDSAFRQRFIAESRAAAAVDHPHIIPIFEAGQASGVLFIAMRFVAGGDVRALVSRLGPLPAGRAAAILTQVASALDAAHARGLVHRDVKPGNMLLGSVAGGGSPDHVYLADFGLSKQAVAAAGLTAAGQFLGTLDYVAPEQIEGRRVDGRADLYGLACTAFELLSGAPPFRRDENLALMWAQISAPPPPLTSRRADLPPAVDQVLARAMAKAPEDRYPTCLDFAAALSSACGLGARAARSRPAQSRPTQSRLTQSRPAQSRPGMSGPRRAESYRSQPRGAESARSGGSRPGPARPGPGPGSPVPVPVQRPRRRGQAARRGRVLLTVAGALVVIAAACAFALLRHSPRPPAGSGTGPGGPARTSGQAGRTAPAATVRAYFAAISAHEYGRAWRLGGRNASASYTTFVQGFSGTARDDARILAVAGHVVTARITAVQTDGTVKTYQGTYTVRNGAIVGFDVRQLRPTD
jgi:serine/threonine protein kinase